MTDKQVDHSTRCMIRRLLMTFEWVLMTSASDP